MQVGLYLLARAAVCGGLRRLNRRTQRKPPVPGNHPALSSLSGTD